MRLAVGSVAIAAVSGAGTAWATVSRDEPVFRWAMIGWSITAAVGVAGSIWMGRSHGRPGSGFVAAVAVCMLARLFLAAAGAWGATRQGTETIGPYILGLAVGYFPLQMYELGWFFTTTRNRRAD